MNLKDAIRQVNNFPKEGILFYDITTLLKSADYLNLAIDKMAEKIQNIDFDCQYFGAEIPYILYRQRGQRFELAVYFHTRFFGGGGTRGGECYYFLHVQAYRGRR